MKINKIEYQRSKASINQGAAELFVSKTVWRSNDHSQNSNFRTMCAMQILCLLIYWDETMNKKTHQVETSSKSLNVIVNLWA